MPPPPTLRAPQMKLVSLISGLGNSPDSLRWVVSLSTVSLGTMVLSCGMREEMRISEGLFKSTQRSQPSILPEN